MTTISKTKIFNMAINELGVTAPIANADAQDDSRAVILRNFYEIAKDDVLKQFDWNFAEKYRTLTPTTDECPDPRFFYVYDVPNDCISARDLFNVGGLGLKIKFKVTANEAGQKIILCNSQEVILRYTRRVDNETLFDSEFATALALYLASLTGQAITGSQEKANLALKKYQTKLNMAIVSNAQEGLEVDENRDTYLDAR